MKPYKLFVLLLLLVIALSGTVVTGAKVLTQEGASSEVKTGVYTPDPNAPPLPPTDTTGATDLVHQGTAWVAESRPSYGMFRPWAWGTETKVKAISDQWVHLAVPYASVLDGTALKLKHAEFCAKSTNGAQTKPTRIDLWANATKIGQWAIAWPADNAYHCAYVDFPTPTWYEGVGISVWLHYANVADKITLYKAWVRLVP